MPICTRMYAYINHYIEFFCRIAPQFCLNSKSRIFELWEMKSTRNSNWEMKKYWGVTVKINLAKMPSCKVKLVCSKIGLTLKCVDGPWQGGVVRHTSNPSFLINYASLWKHPCPSGLIQTLSRPWLASKKRSGSSVWKKTMLRQMNRCVLLVNATGFSASAFFYSINS